jgi:hypothetical protein
MLRSMAVTDFSTKVAVVVRDDLATWQPPERHGLSDERRKRKCR